MDVMIGGGGQDLGIGRRAAAKGVLHEKEAQGELEMVIEEIVVDEIGNETETGRGTGIEIVIVIGDHEMIVGIGIARGEVPLRSFHL